MLLLALATGAWGAWSPSSFADGDFRVQGAAAAVHDGELWSFGGRGIDTTVTSPPFEVTDQVWAYNLTTDSWRKSSSGGGPSPRQDSSAVFVAQKLYVFGGLDGANTNQGDFWSFDSVALTWAQLTGGPVARKGHASVVDGLGRVWILGGYVQGGATNLDAWIYDVGLGSWSQAADGPEAIADHSAIYEPTGNGKIWILAPRRGCF